MLNVPILPSSRKPRFDSKRVSGVVSRTVGVWVARKAELGVRSFEIFAGKPATQMSVKSGHR